MRRDRTVALYAIHSWVGLVFAVLVFVVCASGAVAVFAGELDHWANPALRTRPGAPVSVDIDAALAAVKAARPTVVVAFVGMPSELRNHYHVVTSGEGEQEARLYVDAETGRVHESRQSYLSWYLRHLHVRLMSPIYGRVIVGLIGVAMLLSVVTGILIHKHLLRDLFRMHWQVASGPRRLLSELHKWVGVWALAFHLMIAATGAWLGLEHFVSARFRGLLEQQANGNDVSVASAAPAPAAMLQIEPVLTEAAKRIAGLEITYVTLEQWGTTAARIVVEGNLPGTLIEQASSQVVFSGVDGRVLEVLDVRTQNVWAQVRAAFEPLHYGYFAGTWLKVVYLLLGLTPALLSLSGALIWFDRRDRLRGKRRARWRRKHEALSLESK